MRKTIQLTGRTIGRLSVLQEVLPLRKFKRTYLCRCKCGNYVEIITDTLLNGGQNKSCGCLRDELSGNRFRTHGGGKLHPAEYKTWKSIKWRCYNKNASSYDRYGERGITVCDEWVDDFSQFYSDMGDRPSDNHSIERIDNDGPYSADNCKWATMHEQTRNTRNNTWCLYQGERMCITDLTRNHGVTYRDALKYIV